MITQLQTERLELRTVHPDDVDRMLEYRSHPDVTRWLLSTEVDPAAFRQAWAGVADDPDDASVAVLLDDHLVGTVSLDLVDGMGQPGMPRRTQGQLGYVFDPAYAGHGYATEAVAALVTHAVDTLGVRRVRAGCFADNLASVRVLEKVGFRREEYGVADSWHAELGWLDGCSYALLASGWIRPAGAVVTTRDR
ncbi:GNAT family N-acetyltransferase [Nocardioides sp. HDW12B]|uniref:GNAT family N-acetyltransferase n=1 Tax=Nocardioides sp. HDW12B TaxID=2714939 RepID=UPI00197FB92E|nr:GNAT family N-acetyltransferase [Nocardioides sp. HDW12B]